jgi:uncharacterized membrane protein HdeD (DUF308 family)
LDFISSVVIGVLVSISGVICKYWTEIIHSTKFRKSFKAFPIGRYPQRDDRETAFYKDRKKSIRELIGIALIILGIIIMGYAEIIFHH